MTRCNKSEEEPIFCGLAFRVLMTPNIQEGWAPASGGLGFVKDGR